jgi:hypothetical protein
MSSPIVLTSGQWAALYTRLKKDYPTSVLAISWKTRQVLGFSIRYYTDCSTDIPSRRYTIRLDFYNDSLKTLFVLKYSEYLHRAPQLGKN